MGNAHVIASIDDEQNLSAGHRLDPAPRPSAPGTTGLLAITPHPIRVRLIAHTDLIAAGLGALIGEHPERGVIVTHACSPSDVDLVLLDGADAPTIVSNIADLTAAGHRLIVVLDCDLDPATRARARAAGAAGFVSNALNAHDLLTALRTATRGPTTPADTTATPVPSVTKSVWCPSGLSPREVHVISLICHGLSNDEIATELFLSINSIKTHVRGAYRKLGVTTRTQAVVWAFDNGFVTGQPVPAQPDRHHQSLVQTRTATG